MIRASMDLHSALSSGRDRHLCSVEITNDGRPESGRLHNYTVVVKGVNGQVIRRGRVEKWPREAKSPAQLLAAALEAAGY